MILSVLRAGLFWILGSLPFMLASYVVVSALTVGRGGISVTPVVAAVAVALLVGLLLLLIAVISESLISSLEHAVSPASIPGLEGLVTTVARVRELLPADIRETPLRIKIIPDPAPNAFLVQALGASRCLFVSQGLLAHSRENDIRALLGAVFERISKPGQGRRFPTLCAALGNVFMAMVPAQWVAMIYGARVHSPRPLILRPTQPEGGTRLSPIGAVRFLLAYPWIELCLRLGRLPKSDPIAFNSPLATGSWGRSVRPALINLYL